VRARLVSFWRGVLGRGRLEREMADEIAFHIEARAAELERRGLEPAEALRQARLEFGAVDRYKEECRESRGLRLFDELRADVRFAIRQLVRAKAFSLSTIALLGVGMGASTALFSTADAVLLRMLPVERPQELRRLAWLDAERSRFYRTYDGSKQPGPAGTRLATSFAYPVYAYLREHTASFSQLVSFGQSSRLNLTLRGNARLASGQLVSGNFFAALGARPLLGRVLSAEDDEDGALAYAGVLGYAFWQREFGGERSVLGQTVLVNGSPVVIVGVLPRGSCGVDPSWCPDLSLPMAMQPVVDAATSVLHEPRRWGFQVIGRLRSGMSDETARLETERLVAEAIRTAPPSEAWDPPKVLLLPGAQGLQTLRSDLRAPLVVLGGAVATVMLVACANVAGLLLARATGRRRELGTRLALGAGRGRLVRQLLTESLLLSALGGALGLALAYLVGDGVGRVFLESERPLGVEVALDGRVLLFTLSLLVLVGIAFGLWPALSATRADTVPALREGRHSPDRSTLRAGKVLVCLQVALSLALVAGSALFVRTLVNLRSETLGFRPENLLVFQLDPTLNGYREGRLLDFHEQVLRGVAALPGVRAASMSRWGLLAGSRTSDRVREPGGPDIKTDLHYVAPRFFETLGFPLLGGRDVAASDREGAPAVAVVNESLARRLGLPAVGRKLLMSGAPVEVVGVAGDTKCDSLREPARPTVYLPFRQHEQRSMTFSVRSSLAPEALVPALRDAVKRVDPNVPLFEIATQSERVSETMRQERLFASLVSGFALLALLLAGIGVHGTLAYRVARRTPEIALRLALGARQGDIVRLVLREALLPVALGVLLGIGASLTAGRLLESQLYGTTPRDPLALAAASLMLVLSSALAGWLPSRRAARTAPAQALRQD
jgi:predicted permease